VWANGVYLRARMEDKAECMLALIGGVPEGKKNNVDWLADVLTRIAEHPLQDLVVPPAREQPACYHANCAYCG
jgi:hypothetical protein